MTECGKYNPCIYSCICHLNPHSVFYYFAYSTYLLSRTTVTLIWPG